MHNMLHDPLHAPLKEDTGGIRGMRILYTSHDQDDDDDEYIITNVLCFIIFGKINKLIKVENMLFIMIQKDAMHAHYPFLPPIRGIPKGSPRGAWGKGIP